MKSRIRKIALILALAALLAGGLYLYSGYRSRQQAQAAAASVQFATLQTGDLTASISATGKVRAGQSATLAWETSGTIAQINVAEGERVEAGDILATLEQTSLSEDIITAQSELSSAQQTLDDLATEAETNKVTAMQNIVTYEEAVKDAQYALDNYLTPSNLIDKDPVEAVAAAKSVLDAARSAFEPYKYQSSSNATRVSLKTALDNAQSDYNSAVSRLTYVYDLDVAEANLAKAHADYDKWKNGPSQAELDAANAKIAAAQATLQMAYIEAPFAATVTLAEGQIGDQVSNGTSAFRIDDLTQLYVDLSVSEIDIQQVAVGQEAIITFDALSAQTYHGAVTKVSRVSDESSDVVNYAVTVGLTDADQAVLVGMTAEVEMITTSVSGAVLIPNEAIRSENDTTVVYVMSANGMSPVAVTLGISSETMTALAQGELKAGDQVLLNPTDTTTSQANLRMGGLFGPMMGGAGGPPPGERPNQQSRSNRSGGSSQP